MRRLDPSNQPLFARPISEWSETIASPKCEIQASSSPGAAQFSAPLEVLGRPVMVSLLLAVVTWVLLFIGIARPGMMYYDEPYFVPEARAFLSGTPNPHPYVPSLARPPLGKMMIAIGMKIAGDTPVGWRTAGVACGALMVSAVYLWTYLLVGDPSLAFLAAGLTLFNNFLYVMSRIGMMDVFFMFFLMWSLVAYTASLVLDISAGHRRLLLIGSGVLIGLATACKWNAVDTLAVFFLVSFALRLARHRPADWLLPFARYARSTQEIGIPALLLGLVLAPILSYSLTYWPLCRFLHRPFGIHELVALNVFIWRFSTTVKGNPYITMAWYAWPLNLKPQRALSYLVGNPVVAWGGLVALAICLSRFWKKAELAEGLVLLLFASNFFQWAVTPEHRLFYYYYYPSFMILGVAMAVCLRRLPARIFGVRIGVLLLVFAFAVFLRCYPQMAHLQSPWDCLFGCWV